MNRGEFAKTAARRQLWLAGAAFCFLTAVLFSMVTLKRSEEALSARIAPQVLRFHVLANSDTAKDQALKLEVKQMLLDTMYNELNAAVPDQMANSSAPLVKGITKTDIANYITTRGPKLEEQAEEFISGQGYSYPVSIRLEKCFFPTKVYGDVVFPCGVYDAVRVLIGGGNGKNWWCVLYPPLCFTDNAYGHVPDSSREELAGLLDEDDFRDLMKNRRVVFGTQDATGVSHENTGEKQYGRSHGSGSDGDSGSSSSLSNEEKEPQLTVHVKFRLLDLLSGRE